MFTFAVTAEDWTAAGARPASGVLTLQLLHPIHGEDKVTTAASWTVRLEAGVGSASVPTIPAGNALRVTSRVPGLHQGQTFTFADPGEGTHTLSELVQSWQVDPETLEPSEESLPGWQAAVDTTAANADAAAAAAINAETARLGSLGYRTEALDARDDARTSRDVAAASATTATGSASAAAGSAAAADTARQAAETAAAGVPAQLADRPTRAEVSATTPPRAILNEKLRGANITVKATGNQWRNLWAEWDWNNWIKPQIDRALALGLNAVRIIGAPEVVNYAVGSTSAIGQAAYEARWSQLATYCAQNGLFLYPCLVTDADFSGHSITYQNAATTTAVAGSARVLAQFRNVVGFDLFQEGAGAGLAATDVLAMFAAVRAVAPLVPLTCSKNTSSGFLDTGSIAYQVAAAPGGSDFIDMHIYTDGVLPDDIDFQAAQFPGRPLLIGEFGANQAATSAEQVARYTAMAAVHNRANVRGSFFWALADQDTVATNQWGVWDNTGFVQGSAPLSSTSGKRSALTDVIPSFAKGNPAQSPYRGPNLLPPSTSRATKTTSGWSTGGGNTTISRNDRGLQIQSIGAGTTLAGTNPHYPVTAGRYYKATAVMIAGSVGRHVSAQIDWYDSANASLSSIVVPGHDLVSQEIGITVVGIAPAGAAYAGVAIKTTDSNQPAGEVHTVAVWFDELQFSERPSYGVGLVDGGAVARRTAIQWRRDTAANLASANPVLYEGEPVFEKDTGKIKIGDGVTAWSGLAYQGSTGSGGITRTVSTITTAVTIGAAALTDYVVFVGAGGAPTLPTAVGNTNRYTIKNIRTTTVSVASTSGQTFDGSASPITLTPNQSIDLVSDGSNWRVI